MEYGLVGSRLVKRESMKLYNCKIKHDDMSWYSPLHNFMENLTGCQNS